MTLFHALANRNFAMLWAGQTICRIGDSTYQIAIAWWVLEKTGSAMAMGAVGEQREKCCGTEDNKDQRSQDLLVPGQHCRIATGSYCVQAQQDARRAAIHTPHSLLFGEQHE